MRDLIDMTAMIAPSDATVLKESVPRIAYISPEHMKQDVRLLRDTQETETAIRAVWPEYGVLREADTIAGPDKRFDRAAEHLVGHTREAGATIALAGIEDRRLRLLGRENCERLSNLEHQASRNRAHGRQ